MASRCYGAIKALAQYRSALLRQMRILLMCFLVLVHLNCCSTVLTRADAKIMKFIRVAQNSCMRFILDLPHHSSVSVHRRSLGFLCPGDMVEVKSLILLHRIVYKSWPSALVSTLGVVRCNEFRRGRSSVIGRFVLPNARTTAATRSSHFAIVHE